MSGGSDAPGMSNLQLRIVSAVILAAVVLALTWAGGTAFRVLCALMAAAILLEWNAISAPRTEGNRIDANRIVALAGLGVTAVALIGGASAATCLGLLALAAAATAVHAMAVGRDLWPAAGLVYAGLPAIAMSFLRGADWAGLVAILFLFAVVWATDILAYFVGRAVGGPKLAPAISPGKTQSGALGGAVGGVMAALLLMLSMDAAAGLLGLGIVALLLSVVSQAGDLFESWVKRRHGVKDSGSMIPGHGGVMDRVDGLIVAAAALYLVGAGLGGPDSPAHGIFG